MNENIYSFENITFNYGQKSILCGLSLQLRPGDILGIYGENGCGKTTLLKIIAGLMHPKSGVIHFPDCDPYIPPVFGILETPKCFNELTGNENLRYCVENNYSSAKADELFKLWNLSEYADKNVRSYSLGMRQKLGLILAFMSDSPLLVFDEPTNSLDYESVNTFYDCVKKVSEQGKTVIIVSHLLCDLRKNCSRIMLLEDGRLKEQMPTESISDFFDISFEIEGQAQKASELLESAEIEMISKNTMRINETVRSVSQIIRLVSQYDVISVVPVSENQKKEE